MKEWALKWLVNFNPAKIEVILVSNIFHDYDLRLTYDDAVLNNVETHKHLGIYLSANNNWNMHIDSIIISASKQVSYLRKLKSKDTLNKLYCTYIRPLLEYRSDGWDGCSINDTNRLEQIQLNAAPIVTGLPIFASLRSLYFETGWENLSDRRQIRKLTLMYKIVNGDAPSYLIGLLPKRVNNITAYNLRNSNDFEIPFSRLCSYEISYIPSTLKLWNEFDPQVRTLQTISRFKSNIKTTPDKIPDYTNVGERKYNIMLTRIRNRSSSLKADLYCVNIIPSPACSCGAPRENADHYCFECPLYTNQRKNLFINLNRLQINDADVAVLTTGSHNYDENI